MNIFVYLFDWAPEVPVMSVPVVGFSFKPKGLALVTPRYPTTVTNITQYIIGTLVF
jgi:hypothetical protein